MSDLRAGVCSVDITPPLGVAHGTWRLRTGLAIGTHDPLLAQAIVVERGGTAFALVATDLVFLDSDLAAMIRARASALTGLPVESIVVTATHNHSAPVLPAAESAGLVHSAGTEAYRAVLPDLVAGSVLGAARHLRPVRIGVGLARASVELSANRVHPGGPVVDRVGVLRIDGADGRPVAALVTWSCHATTVGGHELEWTADFPGALRPAIQERFPGLEVMFLQGTAGDINPLDHWFGNPDPVPMGFEAMDTVGRGIADAALEVLADITTRPDAPVGIAREVVPLAPRRLRWSMDDVDRAIANIRAIDAGPYPVRAGRIRARG